MYVIKSTKNYYHYYFNAKGFKKKKRNPESCGCKHIKAYRLWQWNINGRGVSTTLKKFLTQGLKSSHGKGGVATMIWVDHWFESYKFSKISKFYT